MVVDFCYKMWNANWRGSNCNNNNIFHLVRSHFSIRSLLFRWYFQRGYFLARLGHVQRMEIILKTIDTKCVNVLPWVVGIWTLDYHGRMARRKWVSYYNCMFQFTYYLLHVPTRFLRSCLYCSWKLYRWKRSRISKEILQADCSNSFERVFACNCLSLLWKERHC